MTGPRDPAVQSLILRPVAEQLHSEALRLEQTAQALMALSDLARSVVDRRGNAGDCAELDAAHLGGLAAVLSAAVRCSVLALDDAAQLVERAAG